MYVSFWLLSAVVGAVKAEVNEAERQRLLLAVAGPAAGFCVTHQPLTCVYLYLYLFGCHLQLLEQLKAEANEAEHNRPLRAL